MLHGPAENPEIQHLFSTEQDCNNIASVGRLFGNRRRTEWRSVGAAACSDGGGRDSSSARRRVAGGRCGCRPFRRLCVPRKRNRIQSLTCVRDSDIRLWHCGTRVGLARHLLEKPIGVFSKCLRRVPPTRRTLTRSVSNKTFIRPLCRTNVQGVRRMMCHLDFQKYEQHDCDAPIPQAAYGKNKQHLFYLFLP